MESSHRHSGFIDSYRKTQSFKQYAQRNTTASLTDRNQLGKPHGVCRLRFPDAEEKHQVNSRERERADTGRSQDSRQKGSHSTPPTGRAVRGHRQRGLLKRMLVERQHRLPPATPRGWARGTSRSRASLPCSRAAVTVRCPGTVVGWLMKGKVDRRTRVLGLFYGSIRAQTGKSAGTTKWGRWDRGPRTPGEALTRLRLEEERVD